LESRILNLCSSCFGILEIKKCPYHNEQNFKYYKNKKKILNISAQNIHYECYEGLDLTQAKDIHEKIFETFIYPYLIKTMPLSKIT
jgi:hypothetical protein